MAKPNPLEGAQEIREMLVTYTKQETIEPLKTLGRYLSFGLAGSVMIALGTLFLALGLLRTLQTQTGGAFAGGGFASTLPYFITLIVLGVIAGLIYASFNRAKTKVLTSP